MEPPRLIASDIDGTLLGSAGRISAGTVTAFERAAAAGCEVVVATGRSRWSTERVIADLDMVRWAICSNGAVVVDRHEGRVVETRAIDPAAVAPTTTAITRRHPSAGFATETPIGIDYSPEFVAARLARRPDWRGHPREGDGDPSLDDPTLKLMVAHPELVQLEWLAAVRESLLDDDHGLQTATSGADFVEVTAPGADKGLVLSDLCDRLGIAAGDVAAFGDHSNDLGMLSWAGLGHAMGNAVEPVRVAAAYRAPSVDDDGVATVVGGWFPG